MFELPPFSFFMLFEANALLTRSQLNQPVVLKWSGATVAQQAD